MFSDLKTRKNKAYIGKPNLEPGAGGLFKSQTLTRKASF